MESQIKKPGDNILNNNNTDAINNSFNKDNYQNKDTNNDNCINSQITSLKKIHLM